MRRLRKTLTVLALMFAVLVALAWWQRAPLLSWYALRGLARAGDQERATWIQRVVNLDADAVPGLMDLLRRDDPRVCANAEAALAALVQRWGRGDSRTAALADELTRAFGNLGTPGREAVLEWYLGTLHDFDPALGTALPLADAAGRGGAGAPPRP